MRQNIYQNLLKTTAPAMVPAIAAVIGSFLGFMGGVRTTSIEGDKAIELEKVKFEFSLIQEVLSREVSKQEASDELRFLVDIGVIGALNRSALRRIEPEDIPSFTDTVASDDIYLSLAWRELHEAKENSDIEKAKHALVKLKEGFNVCIVQFAQDLMLFLETSGAQGFGLMADIKRHYNETGFCQLPDGHHYPPTEIASLRRDPFFAKGGSEFQIQSLEMEDSESLEPGTLRLPPYRIQLEIE